MNSSKLIAILTFILTFLVYAFTSNQTLTYTDNGELAAACVSLGIAHPTGYPLFTILGHFWSLLPIPLSKIASLNLLAGVYTSMSAVFLFFIIRLLLNNITFQKKIVDNSKKKKNENKIQTDKINLGEIQINFISFLTSIAFAFADTVWAQATSLEVYSLEILLMNIVIFLILKAYFDKMNRNFLILTAFFIGLGMTNHMTSVLMFPAILWLYFLNENNKFQFTKSKFNFLVFLLIPFLLALSLYLYLPIRSSMEPIINWGWVHRGFSKFLYHLQGRQYQVWMFSGSDVMIHNLGTYFKLLPFQFGFVGILIAIFGIFKTWKSKPVFWFLMLLIIFDIMYAINYSIFDIDSYFLLSFISLFIFFSVGLAFLMKINKNWIFVGILILAVNILYNFKENDHSEDFMVSEYTKSVLKTLDSNAVVISAQWDYFVAPFIYLQQVEGVRKDIVLLEKELLRRTWYPYQFKRWYPDQYTACKSAFTDYEKILEKFEESQPYDQNEIQRKYLNTIDCVIQNNIKSRPVYITLDVLQSESDFFNKYTVIPVGFALQLFEKETLPKINLKKIDISYFEKVKGQYKGILPENMESVIADNIFNVALYGFRTGQIEETKVALKKALFMNPNHEMANRLQLQINKSN